MGPVEILASLLTVVCILLAVTRQLSQRTKGEL